MLPPDAPAGVQAASVSTADIGCARAIDSASSGDFKQERARAATSAPILEAALAELQKPDAATSPASAPTPTASPVVAPSVADRAADTGASDETVSWMWPADGKLTGPYEESKKGIDIAGKSGQQVVAAAAGKVLYAGTMRGYGNLVIVKHSNSLLSAYAHNRAILVKEGQTVAKGQAIAEMGDSDTDSVKLHFEVRQQGKPVDPSKFLPAR